MTEHYKHIPVIIFDPGGSTGFAALDECGEVLFTVTLSIQELNGFLEFIQLLTDEIFIDVVVEQGPEFSHHSPVTRRAERMILEIFPNAHRVPPTKWKSHPISARHVNIPKRLVTKHEQDAVRLGRWFQRDRSNTHGSQATKGTHTAGKDSRSS